MGRVLYRDLALVDHDRRALGTGFSILVDDGRIAWIRPKDAEPDPGGDFELIDAGGTTAIPGMVDAHSHLTMPGGSHWLDRMSDDTATLWRVAEHNATLLRQAGVRWARDVGAPVRDGRALSLTIRDAWRGTAGYPHVRAAGTWLTLKGTMAKGHAAEVEDGDGLLRAAQDQLDQGADLIKLYMAAPDRVSAPFSADEVGKVVAMAGARGAKVTAHCSYLDGARAAAAGGVAGIEHGFQLDDEVVGLMTANKVTLISTLAVLESCRTFANTSDLPRFVSPQSLAKDAAEREWAHYSVRLAHKAGVMIAAGTDFGGGTLRANQLAWEVCTLVTAGLDPYAALQAATANGGALLGESEAGRLFEGGPADFVLVHGDPLSDPAAMWRVWRVSW